MTRMTPMFQAAMIACFQLALLVIVLAMVRSTTSRAGPALLPFPTAPDLWTAPGGAPGDR